MSRPTRHTTKKASERRCRVIAIRLAIAAGAIVLLALPAISFVNTTDRGSPVTTITIPHDIPEEQRSALADGEVTAAEARAALEATAKCIRERGFEARIVEFTSERRGWHLRVSGNEEDESVDLRTAHEQCSQKYSDAITTRYLGDD